MSGPPIIMNIARQVIIIRKIFNEYILRSFYFLQSLILFNYGFWSSIFFIVQQRQVEKKIASNSEIMKIVCQLFRMIKVWATGFIYHYRITMAPMMDTHLLIEAKLRQ